MKRICKEETLLKEAKGGFGNHNTLKRSGYLTTAPYDSFECFYFRLYPPKSNDLGYVHPIELTSQASETYFIHSNVGVPKPPLTRGC